MSGMQPANGGRAIPLFNTTVLPTEAKSWLSNDGKKHDNYADAAASNLAIILSGNASTEASITPALAKTIIANRNDVLGLLLSVQEHEAAKEVANAA